MKISVGILSYKRTDLLTETLNDLLGSKFEFELIILNNNEDICILSDIKSVIGRDKNIILNYIHDNKNYGVALGRRKIIDSCQSDYIIMLDDDVAVPDFDLTIKSCLEIFSSESEVKGVAFNITEFSSDCHNKYEIPHKNKKIDMSVVFDTYLMIGAGHALDVRAAKDVGNYPDDFGLYGFEEVDLSFRLVDKGYKIKYHPLCRVKHKKSPDGRFSNTVVNQLAFVNRCKMAKRYFKFPYFLTCLFVRSVFFLLKTKNLRLFFVSLNEIFSDKKNNKFGLSFYKYIKSVNGFIYW
ncbi:glycosyltransferase [Vibrio fluvialis]|nr:glycosyltransferase [Vibrio fluvialis]